MKTWCPPSPRSRPVLRRLALWAGFTLIEVLVVMSLLSLVMLAMGSALRTTAQTEERVDQRLQRTDEMRVADGFLRSILGRVAARKVPLPVEPGASQFIFSAQAGQLTWVGVMPARHGAGGRYHFRLQVQDTSTAQQALVLQYTPWLCCPTGARRTAMFWCRVSRHLPCSLKMRSLNLPFGRRNGPLQTDCPSVPCCRCRPVQAPGLPSWWHCGCCLAAALTWQRVPCLVAPSNEPVNQWAEASVQPYVAVSAGHGADCRALDGRCLEHFGYWHDPFRS